MGDPDIDDFNPQEFDWAADPCSRCGTPSRAAYSRSTGERVRVFYGCGCPERSALPRSVAPRKSLLPMLQQMAPVDPVIEAYRADLERIEGRPVTEEEAIQRMRRAWRRPAP